MSPKLRGLLVFLLLIGTLGTVASYGWAYDSHLGQHTVSVMFEPADSTPNSAVGTPDDLPPKAAESVRTGVEDGFVTVHRDDRDEVAEALESLPGYVRVDGETYRVVQVADENMTLLGPLPQLTALFLSLGVLGVGVAILRNGALKPLSAAAAMTIPGVALAVDVAVTLLDSMLTFSGGADLPVVPAATGFAVVGVAARTRDWPLAVGGTVVVLLAAQFASVLGGTSLGPLGSLVPGAPLFALGYLLGGGRLYDVNAGRNSSTVASE
ncbi:hypothetical protein KU306_13125 [Haloferax larsenii]|uniref:Uncharacterized protein n=1 Tax=Haloferax larsenii TaxID=302484 RepID=A0ABY5RE10_HALLR|nr:hypothetical protein [Haloferax larsenii]ELZ81427.1 hypothetical protein C455_04521 [Haloferax larsenii JCM 13917]UVE49847.1 hypothetical protein KU306_13125 [Haloferax larsenii]